MGVAQGSLMGQVSSGYVRLDYVIFVYRQNVLIRLKMHGFRPLLGSGLTSNGWWGSLCQKGNFFSKFP